MLEGFKSMWLIKKQKIAMDISMKYIISLQINKIRKILWKGGMQPSILFSESLFYTRGRAK